MNKFQRDRKTDNYLGKQSDKKTSKQKVTLCRSHGIVVVFFFCYLEFSVAQTDLYLGQNRHIISALCLGISSVPIIDFIQSLTFVI